MNDLNEMYNQLAGLYNDIKNEIRRKDKFLYERWKAGGFMVDEGMISDYPSLLECVVAIETDKGEDEDDEQGCED